MKADAPSQRLDNTFSGFTHHLYLTALGPLQNRVVGLQYIKIIPTPEIYVQQLEKGELMVGFQKNPNKLYRLNVIREAGHFIDSRNPADMQSSIRRTPKLQLKFPHAIENVFHVVN